MQELDIDKHLIERLEALEKKYKELDEKSQAQALKIMFLEENIKHYEKAVALPIPPVNSDIVSSMQKTLSGDFNV